MVAAVSWLQKGGRDHAVKHDKGKLLSDPNRISLSLQSFEHLGDVRRCMVFGRDTTAYSRIVTTCDHSYRDKSLVYEGSCGIEVPDAPNGPNAQLAQLLVNRCSNTLRC